jgi:methyl-accepting chemotaxis protein
MRRDRECDDGGFFAFHGLWSPGVRLFRAISFPVKAMLVSVGFLVPLAMLLLAYLDNVQSSLEVARQERAGLQMLVQIEPWLVAAQRQRRLVMSGDSIRPDMADIDSAQAPAQALLEARPEHVDVTASLAAVAVTKAALVSAVAAAHGSTPAQPLQAYVEAMRKLRSDVLDASQLSLDPEQTTYYLMMAATSQGSDAIEGISRSRGLAATAAANGGHAADLFALHDAWHDGVRSLDGVADSLARAEAASPGLGKELPLAQAVAASKAFFEASARAWFGETLVADVHALDTPGQAAVDALRALSQQGMSKLDGLLVERIAQAVRMRNITLATTVGSLAMVLYLFRCFYAVMRGGLAEVERHMLAMTDGDLTTSPRPWGSDEAAALMVTLARMQHSLRGIVSEVRQASEGLVHASDEIASASTDLSQRSEQAAASLQASSSAMEQISTTVLQAAEATRTAAQLAAENADVADQGGRTIEQVVASMNEVQSSSARISDIIGVIDGIAFQTNILALNAAVEAARAGEQGRGFAVVASEVRALAQRSASAAREVKTLITNSVERVEAGTQVVGAAGGQMREMVANAERMKALMARIFDSAAQQSAGVRQVDGSIQTLDEQTQQNAALVEETAAAAVSLHDQAVALAGRVARFRLPGQVLSA